MMADLEKANYELMKGQQLILLAAVEAERYETHGEITGTPEDLIEKIDSALQLIEEALLIVNGAATVTDEVRDTNNTNLADMTTKANDARSKVVTRLKKQQTADTKLHFASLLADISNICTDYVEKKHDINMFGAWSEEYFHKNHDDLKIKAANSLIDWGVAQKNSRALAEMKLKLSRQFFEAEQLKAENDKILTMTSDWEASTKCVMAELDMVTINSAEFMNMKVLDKSSMKIAEYSRDDNQPLFLEAGAPGAAKETSKAPL